MRVRNRRLTPITTDPYTQPAVAIPWPTPVQGVVHPRDLVADRAQAGVGRRILVAGLGYRNLRDMSAGPEIVERLRAQTWPDNVQVEDLSFGAIHVMHWLQDRPPFDVGVIVASAARGRTPGEVTRSVWKTPMLPAEAVQAAIAEAVTGVISLDTLLTVLGYFGVLPPRVVVVEIEPRDDDWGADFSPSVQKALSEAVAVVRAEVEASAQ